MLTGASSALARCRAAELRHRRRHARDHAGGGRPQLRLQRVRVGLLRQHAAVARANLVLVARAGADAGQEDLPDAAFAPQAHRVAAASQRLKSPTTLTATRSAPRPRSWCRPRPASRAASAPSTSNGRRCEPSPSSHTSSSPSTGGKRYGSSRIDRVAVGPAHLQPVVRAFGEVQQALEEAVVVALRERADQLAVAGVEHRDLRRTGQHGAQPEAADGVGVQRRARRTGRGARPGAGSARSRNPGA